MDASIQIRPIELNDNLALAKVIRGALEEFGANKPGTVYFDPTTDALFQLFNTTPGAYYYVALKDNELVGLFPVNTLNGAKNSISFSDLLAAFNSATTSA